MATTRIMPIHAGKAKNIGRAISAVIDYVKNADKTDNGRLITSYQCNPQIADAEFLFSKRQYAAISGLERENDVKPEMRFHDLRHAYAFLSLKSGIDIKTLQENMGHYSSSFTLDVYGYSSSAMKESAAKNLDNEIMQITGA
ncbi:MAG: tyrosine-type recombinase/integrase [Eubacteriales bacterium]|nr:tyrosine-type recombinase/integrase [Eubacteriales bacterium]